jgi:hypothetical protein
MRNEVPRQEGRDHDTSRAGGAAFAAALLLAALSAALPSADATAQGAVPCTAIDDDEERLACYDRALRGTPPAPSAAPTRAAPPASSAPPAAAQPPRQAETGERPQERRMRESTAPAARPAPAAPAAARDDDGEGIVPLVIVGVRALPGRETTFTTADGTSWVQTDSQRIIGLPDPPFDAELKPGAMGSHFLVPANRARAIRVRQVNR